MIEKEAGLSVLREVMRDVDEFQQGNSAAKAAYIGKLISRLEERVGRVKTIDILRQCGEMCCGVTTRRRVKELASGTESLKELVRKLNEAGLGGGRLKMKDENTIVGGYNHCYCGLVKPTTEPFPTDTYCWCSTGWYKQLFETALDQPVKVVLLRSIVSGADECEFVIRLR